tara:strand:- start:426 stop:662 length:237 start_codon:yes stop_codon:yes gene_type:complete
MKYKHSVITTVTRTITYEFELEAFTNDPDGDEKEIKDQAIEELKRMAAKEPVLIDVLNDDLEVEDIQITQTWVQGGVD